MKSQQPASSNTLQGQPGGAKQGERDAEVNLAALGDRLAAQEEQLQSQLSQQLNLQSLSSRLGQMGLASVGENAELGAGSQPQTGSYGRQGAPRFAGNAAFQSAMARHSHSQSQSAASRPTNQDLRAMAHQRQLSLQGRFAELGYNTSALGNLSTIPGGDYEDSFTDDTSAMADFMGTGGFDPTRRGLQPQPQSPTMQRQRSPHGHQTAASMSGAFPTQTSQQDLLAEQIALQQQIEMLQMQQQQLLQQQVSFNPSVNMGGQPQSDRPSHSGFGSAAGHRRIQSHAPQSGSFGNFNVGGIGSIGSLGNPFSSGTQISPTASMSPTNSNQPSRGHGRRHSVNVVKAGEGGNEESSYTVNTSPPFSFPNPGSQSVARGQMGHPSVQLSSTLSPEYLMAGGGMLNFSNLSAGSELADGFGGGVRAGAGGHGRSGSQSWRINGAQPGPSLGGDLSQAQAQLASLHQFRAQAGGGAPQGSHSKHTSLSGGFNPQGMMGAPGMPGAFGAFPPAQAQLQQQQQQQQGGANAQRKALFGSYLPQSSLAPLLAAGKIVVGQIRVDKRNRSDAYVATEILDSDIYISGSRDRNRALSGDIVAVELLDPQEVWLSKKAKEDKKKHKEEQAASSRKPDKAKDDLEVEGAQLRMVDDEADTEQAPPALAGHVVAIVERAPGQLFCGTIGLLRPSSAATKEKQQAERRDRGGADPDSSQGTDVSQRPKIVWHRPLNKTTPLIAIPADQAPADFWEPGGQEKYANIMFTVAIKRWPITSLHPFGTLVEEIGVMGNVEAETQAILKDNLATATEEFSEAALKCVPPLPFTIPDREYEHRRDFRKTCVFTIDPSTAKDLDDAVSVTRLDAGLVEIGVHIADVSHFVKLNSALDREARKRCTTVYLVQQAFPMLPKALSEELCSLVPGVERLSVSAVFTMNREARIIGTWLGRSIIKSCTQLAYSDAQAVIDDGSLPEGAKIDGGYTREQIAEDITTLHQLAQKMRSRRFGGGALRIDQVKLDFKLDEDGIPTDASAAQGKESNQLIEEFMLAANQAVSQRIAAGLPEVAMLRRHEGPLERRLEGFQRRAKQMGHDVDISSAGALFASFKKITDPQVRFALETLATKSMLRAKYFCAGMTDISKYHHYALNIPVYTHFTSPIRRYADIVVHRQLEAVLNPAQSPISAGIDREGIAKIAQQCNVKKDAAKAAQEQSQHLFLCMLIHDLTVRYGPVVRQATIIGVLDAAFDIVVPEFGIEKRVHMDQIPIQHHTYDEESQTLDVYWRPGVDTITWQADNSDDPHIKALHKRAMQDAEARAGAVESRSRADDEAALFDDADGSDDQSGSLAEAKRRLISGEDARESVQRTRSRNYKQSDLIFQGIAGGDGGGSSSSNDGNNGGPHKIQSFKVLQTVPVVVSASVGTKSPPVITVFAVNPFASNSS